MQLPATLLSLYVSPLKPKKIFELVIALRCFNIYYFVSIIQDNDTINSLVHFRLLELGFIIKI